jgi:hypothetical protein
MGIARLAWIVLAAVVVLGLAAVAAASAMEPLFNEGGVSITGDSHLTVLIAGANTIDCRESQLTGSITTIQLIEKEVVHYLGCTSTGAGGADCPVRSIGAAEGLILFNTVHGILGLILPNDKIGILLSTVSVSGANLLTTLAKNCLHGRNHDLWQCRGLNRARGDLDGERQHIIQPSLQQSKRIRHRSLREI